MEHETGGKAPKAPGAADEKAAGEQNAAASNRDAGRPDWARPGPYWDPGPRDDLELQVQHPVMRAFSWFARVRGWVMFSAFALLVAGGATYWWIKWLPRVDASSAQWSYSSIFQGTAGLMGLGALAVTFLWSQAGQSRQELQQLVTKYASIAFAPAPGFKEGEKGWLSRVTILIAQLGNAIRTGTVSAAGPQLPGRGLRSSHEVLYALIRWAYALSWRTRVRIPIPVIRGWLKDLGFDNEERLRAVILAPSVVDRAAPLSLFGLQADLFSPPNFVLERLDESPSGNLYWQVVQEMLHDGIFDHLRRMRTYERFRRGPLRLVVFAYGTAMCWSLMALAATTASSQPCTWVLGVAVLAALASVVVTIWCIVGLARQT